MMGMEMSWFREGRLIVFELMTEEAAINFWEVRRLTAYACLAGTEG
jgi:hypothetical protein